MHWQVTTLLVCIYGVVKEFRPAAPFLTPFLESEKNFTDSELSSKIYPFWTYGHVISLIPVFILTDFLKYKPVIILEALTLIATFALLVWGNTIFQMQLMQICFGISSSAEIAYLSYLYAIVRKKHYTKITSYTRAAKLIGKFLAYSMAQFLVSSGYGSYLLLHQITLGSMCLIVVIALFLPSINKGEDQVVSATNNNEDMEIQPLDMEKPKIENERLEKKDYVSGLKAGVKIYLANHVVLFWSIWWALSSCGAYQVYNYSQNLWALMQHNNQETFNGIVFIATTLIGALLTFSLPYIKVNWQHHGTVVFVISSVCLGVSLVLMGTIHNLFLAYVLYIVVDMVYRLSNTIASNVIASELTSNSYSFIFGCDMFMALVLETGLTLIVADEHGLALDIRYQFIVYSGYFIVLAILFVILSILVRLRRANSKNLNEQQDIKS